MIAEPKHSDFPTCFLVNLMKEPCLIMAEAWFLYALIISVIYIYSAICHSYPSDLGSSFPRLRQVLWIKTGPSLCDSYHSHCCAIVTALAVPGAGVVSGILGFVISTSS